MWSEVPCKVCGVAILVPERFSAGPRRDLVRCDDHLPPPPDDSRPLTAIESWHRGVPSRFHSASIEQIPHEAVRDLIGLFAASWPENIPRDVAAGGVLLTGATGTGKTAACFALLNHLIRSGRVHPTEVLVRREEEWLPPLAQVTRFGNANQARSALSNHLAGKRVVLLDDCGYGRYPSREDQQSVLLSLLERVESRDILLLVTTNAATVDDLKNMFGPAGFSRLWSRVGQMRWTLGTEDIRLRGAPVG